jgi:hypothetical protein
MRLSLATGVAVLGDDGLKSWGITNCVEIRICLNINEILPTRLKCQAK